MGYQRTWGVGRQARGSLGAEGPVAAGPDAGPTVRWTFQRLRMAGLSTDEAGNLTAHVTGLRIARRPWTMNEIERLVFLRALVEAGRLVS